MECKLHINQLVDKKVHVDDRTEFVLFATHNLIIYRDRQFINLASCKGKLLARVKTPANHTEYDHLEFDDSILFMVGGNKLIWMDNNGLSPINTDLNPLKVGQCLTKIYRSNNENGIIFGTKKLGKIQFVHYDFIEHCRITQTASWKVNEITNMYVKGNILYATLDYSTIVNCNMQTGETLWTRFETAKIQKGIIPIEGWLFYTCQGFLKKTNGIEQELIQIPLVQINSLECYIKNDLYFTFKDKKSLCKYNIRSKKIIWKIHGQHPIEESIQVKSSTDDNLLLVRTNNNVNIINLDKGRSEATIRVVNVDKLRCTGNHVLIHKKDGSTVLIPGVEK